MTFQELVEAYERKKATGTTAGRGLYTDPLVEQGVFLLEKAMGKMCCAYCPETCNQLEAAQAAKNAWWNNNEVRYQCPDCSFELIYRVTLQSEQVWEITPENRERLKEMVAKG
jgi:transposase-like protein